MYMVFLLSLSLSLSLPPSLSLFRPPPPFLPEVAAIFGLFINILLLHCIDLCVNLPLVLGPLTEKKMTITKQGS